MRTSVVCACTGNYPEGDRYVHALWEGFHRHLGREFNFYCIYDDPDLMLHEEIQKVRPARNVWGWWNLMEIFRPDAPWSEDYVIMVGLDTVIRGDVSFLAEATEPAFLQEFSDQYGIHTSFNGMIADGAVALPAGNHLTWLWDQFCERVSESTTHQEMRNFPMHVWNTLRMQEADYRPLLWQEIMPGRICSYKWRPQGPQEEPLEPLVIFHGNPRPHEAVGKSPWIKKHWNPEK